MILARSSVPILMLLLAAPAGVARAQLSTLRQGWSLYHQGQLEAARREAQQTLARTDTDEERRDAHLLLGAIAWQGGDRWAAEDRIINALSYDPGYQPDPLHLSPELQELVRRVARERRDEVARRALARRAPPRLRAPFGRAHPSRPAAASRAASPPTARHRTESLRVSPVTPQIRSTPIYLAPLPFGIGQFLNGHRRKAWVLLVSETALAATSIACVSAALALRDRRGRYPEDVIGAARALNGVYLGSAYSALVLVIYGAIDGLVYRRRPEPSTRTAWLPGPAGSLGVGLRHAY